MRQYLAFPVFLLIVGCTTTSSTPPYGPRFVQGGSGRLWVDDGGTSGIPVIFVHGNGASEGQWAAQLSHLRTTRRAVAFDLRGMGSSDLATDSDYSVGAVSEDIGAVADALGIRRFVLVGHSYGGAIVGAYAAAHPERVAGLVFVDSAGEVRGTPQAGANKFEAMLRSDKGDAVIDSWFAPMLAPSSSSVREMVLTSAKKTNREVFVSALASLRSFDPTKLRDHYHGPVLIVTREGQTPPDSLQAIYPDLPRRTVTASGHWVMLDQPEQLNAILDDFLSSLH